MPQAAGVWVAQVVSAWAVAAGAAATGIVAATYVGLGVGYVIGALAISYALSAVSTALMGRPPKPKPAARDIVIKSAIAPRSIIYGEATVGGVLTYINTTGNKNEYLDFVIAVAGHQVEAITDVWFDDKKITNSQIGGGAATGGAVGSGEFAGVAWIYKYLGTDAQTASTILSASDHTGYNPFIDRDGQLHYEWTSDHRLRSVAYVHIRLHRDNKVFDSGPPGNFKFHVKGARVYDPRKDSTNGGSGSHRLEDARTWEYSSNPALCIADYIVGGTLVNDVATPVRRRGFGAATTDVDWDYVIAGANLCEESVSVPTTGSPQAATQNRYSLSGMLTPAEEFPDADCLEQLLTAMLGQVVCTNGTYRMYGGAYDVPSYSLTEADLAGPLTNKTGAARADRYNYVRGTKYDQELGTEVEFTPRTDTSYQTEDGRVLYRDIELPMTDDDHRAQRMGQIILRRSREQETLAWPGQLSAAKVAIWETVQVSVAELGISNKVYRCIDRKVRTSGEGAPVELVLREESSSTYTDPLLSDYGSIVVTSPAETPDDSLWPPTGLTTESVSGGILFRITPDDRNSANVIYEIWEYSADSPPASGVTLWSGAATAIAYPKDDQVTRYYRVRAKGSNGAVSTFYPASGFVSGVALAAGAGPQGEPGITIQLTRVHSAVWAYADGTVPASSFTNTNGDFLLFEGPTQVPTGSITYSVTAQVACTGSINAAGHYSVSAMTADEATLALRAVYQGNAYNALYTLSKIRAGYEIVNTLPTTNLFNGRMVFLTSDGKLYRYLTIISPADWVTAVEAVDIEGQITEGQIADGAVSITKFADSMRPVEIVSSMPTTGLTVGMLVYLTAWDDPYYKDRLYRYTATGWESLIVHSEEIDGEIQAAQIAGLEASKITGQLTDDHIAGIAAAKLTTQITSTQIADGAITTPKIHAGSVTANEIAAGAIGVDELAANSVTAVAIAAGQVTGAKIAAGTIYATQIAAGAITGDRIAGTTITGDKLAANTITAGQIAAGAIGVNQLAANAVRADKIQAGTIVGTNIAGSTITGNLIQGGTITAALMAADSITAMNGALQNLTVETAKIVDLAVDTIKIAHGAVTTGFNLSLSLGGATGPATIAGNWTNLVIGGNTIQLALTGIDTSGRVVIWFTASGRRHGNQPETGYFRCYRVSDNFVLSGQYTWKFDQDPTSYSAIYIDSSPRPGSETYRIQVTSPPLFNYANGIGNWDYITLFASVFKR